MRQVRNNLKNHNSLSLQQPLTFDDQQRWVELLEDIAKGDQAALGSLYDDTSSLIFGLILRIIGDRSSAEEVLLKVFKQVWRQAARYDARRGQPLAWIMRIAREHALAYRRANNCNNEFTNPLPSLTQDLPFTAPQTTPEPDSAISQQRNHVCAALARLSFRQREIIELAYYGGLNQQEIALRLGLSLDIVNQHMRLGMMELREFLKPVLQEQR